MDDLKNFSRYFRPYKLSLIVGISCILCSVLFSVYVPLIIGQAIDANWTYVSVSRLTISALKVLGASILSGVLLFVTMPLVSLTVKFFGQQVHTRFEKIQEFFAHITARAQENFTGVRVVRAYAQEDAEIAAFSELNREYAERNLSLVRIDAMMRPLMQFLIGIGFVLIVWAGVPLAPRTP